MSTGSSGLSGQGTNSIPHNRNHNKIHYHKAGDKRRHLSDDESCDDDDDDDDDDDRLSVTAGHDSHVTVNDEEDLSLYSNEVEKGGGDCTIRRARYTIIVCQ